uniref:Zf-RING_UBOX domain-containing protein n=1 Tax=Steinernema glaseri TaxID=37863 RepID=A0A1I7ZS20_9BILA
MFAQSLSKDDGLLGRLLFSGNIGAQFKDIAISNVDCMERLLKCAICLRLMEPATLLCSHSYCRDCIIERREDYKQQIITDGRSPPIHNPRLLFMNQST